MNKENNIDSNIQKHEYLNDKEICFKEYVHDIDAEINKSISLVELSDDFRFDIIKKAVDTLPVEYDDLNGSIAVNDAIESGYASYCFDGIEDWIAEYTFDNNPTDIPHDVLYSQANKLFAASLFTSVNKIQRDYGAEQAVVIADSVYRQYLTMSPNIINGVNNLPDQMELLSLADRSSVCRKKLHSLVMGEITYDVSFDETENDISELIKNSDSIAAIHLLKTQTDLCNYALGVGRDTELIPKALEVFKSAKDNKEVAPLVRIMAQYEEDIIYDEMKKNNNSQVGGFVDRNDLENLPENKQNQLHQDLLHSQFPYFHESDYLNMIAPNVCSLLENGQISYIVDRDKHMAQVSDWQPDNEFDISEDDMFLIQVAHNPNVKAKFESELGVKLQNINLETQIYLLRFAAEANDGRYDKLINELDSGRFADESEKMQLIEAFLALEFGDDFGDRLLTISEKLETKESQNIYSNINQIRQDSKGIAEHFDFSIDKEDSSTVNMESAIETAWIKRTTELLAILADANSSESDIKNASVAINILRYTTSQIKEGLNAQVNLLNGSSAKDADHVTLMADNGVTLTLRSKFDPNKWNQRIGFNIKIPEEMFPDGLREVKSKNKKISIRLDYDEFGLSLDIGSTNMPGLNVSPVGVFIGETLTKGEALIDKSVMHGNHVREVFDNFKMDDKKFADLVRRFASSVKLLNPQALSQIA